MLHTLPFDENRSQPVCLDPVENGVSFDKSKKKQLESPASSSPPCSPTGLRRPRCSPRAARIPGPGTSRIPHGRFAPFCPVLPRGAGGGLLYFFPSRLTRSRTRPSTCNKLSAKEQLLIPDRLDHGDTSACIQVGPEHSTPS